MLRLLGAGTLATVWVASLLTGCGGDGGKAPAGGEVAAGGASGGGAAGTGAAMGGSGAGTRAGDAGAGTDTATAGSGAANGGAGGAAAGTGAAMGGSGAGTGACDLTGTWIVKRVLFTTPDSPLAPGAQKVSNWDLFEIAQQGDEITITDHLFAGIVTTGDARVSMNDATLGALQEHLDETGRRGTFAPTTEGCSLALERVYNVMGASPIDFYRGGVADPPGHIDGDPALSTLEPMPTAGGNPGADDWDGDGKPGIQFIITDSPLGSGVRHETQRDWHEMSGTVPAGSDEFQVPVTWDFEETVVEASSPFFSVVAVVREGAPHTALWRRVDDSIRGADDVATAKNVQAAMPHEPLPRDGI